MDTNTMKGSVENLAGKGRREIRQWLENGVGSKKELVCFV